MQERRACFHEGLSVLCGGRKEGAVRIGGFYVSFMSTVLPPLGWHKETHIHTQARHLCL